MGSDFLTNKQFQTTLEENPELISWSSLREVILHRAKTGKLGFKVHTFKVRILSRVPEKRIMWVFDDNFGINFHISPYKHMLWLYLSHITQKCVLGDFRPDKIQTSLLSYRN